ncbi:hypothetical protein GUITHDRAFT_150699 [Guillardia theta CCMP2712]|uniref:Uncharacterized protein n=1 Tax=Guillardia theta (strain CCMP2712) TaxID=905079 RepID=L1JU98_GUITC|nr:hypothetical protein GUITHDRAFT_150699 [Guillardia theta CCMP2712]EKX52146.1 hypothetical protein GUITHDRAFT_150699 [Guillardia theta CCMP2712]|eukprot:XP_005839126.1 hypothetical protein GUITHDRAFT_150699 [Guillardia theta CCMP2712]
MLVMARVEEKNAKVTFLTAYVLSWLYCSFGFIWMYRAIFFKNDNSHFQFKSAEGTVMTLSKKEYDINKLGESLQAFVTIMVFVGMIAYQLGEFRVVFMVSVYMAFSIAESELFRIHMLGQSDEVEELRRPFGQKNDKPFEIRKREGPTEDGGSTRIDDKKQEKQD